ncbi:hypothetical protein F2Q68_00045471 [Brassica cretica]|uniref:Uncharacterized protein n=1 Tax=Brassica cretica TaxID=69181 RepID=A0A8S9LWI2_BRACR|nr:hypothetical protein F2Q68_00045471 [Brassica cretica]
MVTEEANKAVVELGLEVEETRSGNNRIENKENGEEVFHSLPDREFEVDAWMHDVVPEEIDGEGGAEDVEEGKGVTEEVTKRQGTRRRPLKSSVAAGASNKPVGGFQTPSNQSRYSSWRSLQAGGG